MKLSFAVLISFTIVCVGSHLIDNYNTSINLDTLPLTGTCRLINLQVTVDAGEGNTIIAPLRVKKNYCSGHCETGNIKTICVPDEIVDLNYVAVNATGSIILDVIKNYIVNSCKCELVKN